MTAPAKLKVNAERNMLATVLRNLMTNAIKFSYEKGEINLTATADKKNIKIRVEDHGSGMSATVRDQLFAKAAQLQHRERRLNWHGILFTA